MNKNLKDLKGRRYRDGNYEVAFRYCLIKVLEDFEKRLEAVEAELGIYTEKETKNIKIGLDDPN